MATSLLRRRFRCRRSPPPGLPCIMKKLFSSPYPEERRFSSNLWRNPSSDIAKSVGFLRRSSSETFDSSAGMRNSLFLMEKSFFYRIFSSLALPDPERDSCRELPRSGKVSKVMDNTNRTNVKGKKAVHHEVHKNTCEMQSCGKEMDNIDSHYGKSVKAAHNDIGRDSFHEMQSSGNISKDMNNINTPNVKSRKAARHGLQEMDTTTRLSAKSKKEIQHDVERVTCENQSSRTFSKDLAKKTSKKRKTVNQENLAKDTCEMQSLGKIMPYEMGTASRPYTESENEAAVLNARPSMAVEESIETLEGLLKHLDESTPTGVLRIGETCLRLAQLCVSMDEDADKILMYGQRALSIFGSNQVSVEYATCLETIGCAYHKKGEFEKAVNHLERAAMILEKLSITVKEKELGSLKYAVQALLGQTNMELGREEEALLNFQEAIAINERVLESHDPSLGKSYQKTAEVCIQAQDFHEALMLCMKALPIYTEHYGESSLQVAELRKLLSVIYYELDEFDKVLSEHEVIRPILTKLGKATEVASLDLAAGEALLCLERYKEAIHKLNDAAKHALSGSCVHGQALVLLSKAYASLKEEKRASDYCKKALDVLKQNAKSSVTGASLVELASVLQSLQKFEQSVSVLEIALQAYQLQPMEQAAAAYIECQIGRLYLLMENFNEASVYLERSCAKMENLHGSESPELLDVYNNIGIAYMQLKKPDEAIAKFEAARSIATLSDVADSEVTVTLYNNLACLYDTLGRVGDSLMCQKLLVDSIKKSGIETIVCLEAAEEKLESLIQKSKTSGNTDGKNFE